jgi:hypothetical protein
VADKPSEQGEEKHRYCIKFLRNKKNKKRSLQTMKQQHEKTGCSGQIPWSGSTS